VSRLGCATLLVVATLLAYAPALRAGFVWDDDDYVTENPLLWEPDGLRRIWLSMDAPSQYFPLTYTSFRLEHALWGLEPAGYHAVNVLLHASNALLLWLLLARLALPGAGLAAAIFALHPVQVESVAWISERKNLLSLLFSLGALLAWLRFCAPGTRRPALAYGGSLALYALALSAKTTACTLPAAQLLVLWLRGERVGARRLAQVLPFLLLGLGMGIVTLLWERYHQGTVGERFALAPLESVLVASRAVWFYLGKLAWPAGLSFSYPKFEIDPGDPAHYLWLALGAALLLALWAWRARIGRGPLVAALFFVATLSPVLGFIPLFTFFYTYVADHYQYVACIGPIALFAGAASRWSERAPGAAVLRPALAGALLALLAALTFQQSRVYESAETLWRDTIAKHPGSWMAHTNLGRELVRQQRWEEAADAYRRALALRPDLHLPHRGAAQAYLKLGRVDLALDHLERALEIRPGFAAARRDLARIRWERGEWEEALRHYRAAAESEPWDSRNHVLLGHALEQLGRPDEAEASYQRARELAARRLGARPAQEEPGAPAPRDGPR
jgi:tetratricopeptide (TPR) repeat protein